MRSTNLVATVAGIGGLSVVPPPAPAFSTPRRSQTRPSAMHAASRASLRGERESDSRSSTSLTVERFVTALRQACMVSRFASDPTTRRYGDNETSTPICVSAHTAYSPA
jgi:hypothetical protein